MVGSKGYINSQYYEMRAINFHANYMHKKNIVHRDIKPENVLIEPTEGDKLVIKLTDFGFACAFDMLRRC